MADFVKFECFAGDLGDKVHALDADTLRVALSNTEPDIAANTIFGDITEIAAGSGYTAGGEDVQNAWAESGGIGKLTGTDVVWTATGGDIGPFRYVILYNDTPAAPVDPLIGYWDYGSSITLLNAGSDTFTTDFGTEILTVQ